MNGLSASPLPVRPSRTKSSTKKPTVMRKRLRQLEQAVYKDVTALAKKLAETPAKT